MKRISLLLLFVGFMVSNAFGTSTAQQTGNWNDPNTWKEGVVPALTEEIKFTGGDDFTVTVNDARGDYEKKLAIARGNELLITAGGSISFADDIKVNDAGASSSGTDVGYLTMTGGTLTGGDRLAVGYAHSTGTPGEMIAYMTISGGTVNITGSGGIKVGCENYDGATGYLKIIGDDATITSSGSGRFFVANDASSSSGDIGHGVVEFELNSSGDVSRIVAPATVIDSQDEEDALAELIMTVTGSAPAADLVLFENVGTSSVVGEFDTISNGTTTVAGTEGAYIQLGTSWFQLTYQADLQADDEDNDIVLLLVPEPTTLALLALGGLLAVRRRK